MKLLVLSVDHISPGTPDHLKVVFDPANKAQHVGVLQTPQGAKRWHVEVVVDEWEQGISIISKENRNNEESLLSTGKYIASCRKLSRLYTGV